MASAQVVWLGHGTLLRLLPSDDGALSSPRPIVSSTSSVISPQQEHTEPSEHRPCRRGVKSSLWRELNVPAGLLRALFGDRAARNAGLIRGNCLTDRCGSGRSNRAAGCRRACDRRAPHRTPARAVNHPHAATRMASTVARKCSSPLGLMASVLPLASSKLATSTARPDACALILPSSARLRLRHS